VTSPDSRFARLYGSHPAHLLLMTAGFAVVVAVVATMTPAALWNPRSWWQSIAVWFVVAIVAHDLIAFPVYALADRILHRGNCLRSPFRVPLINYVRLPSMAAALTFLIFLPGIIEQGGPAYQAATGQTQEPFLARWLWLTATFYLAAALTYGVRTMLERRRGGRRGTAMSPEAEEASPTG
jgi:hypothetical protein